MQVEYTSQTKANSDAAGLIGVSGLVDYCASKFGAFGFDESLRMELRKMKTSNDIESENI